MRLALGEYLPRDEPSRYLYELVPEYPLRAGRMLRPSICIATARAFGGSIRDVMRSAVALELLHNAFLVHDDIEDDSEQRRGAPTLHRQHGVPMSINVGDTLTLLALRPLLENREVIGPELALSVLDEFEGAAREAVEGQAMELGWRRDGVLNLDAADYAQMVIKKTAWYTFIYPLRVGALIAKRDPRPSPRRFVHFGSYLGIAFQIIDDVHNLARLREGYGKEPDGDIYEGKRTLMLIWLLQRVSDPERRRVERFLASPRAERAQDEAAWIRMRMEAYGCVEEAIQHAASLAERAHREFERDFRDVPRTPDRDCIEGLTSWVTDQRSSAGG